MDTDQDPTHHERPEALDGPGAPATDERGGDLGSDREDRLDVWARRFDRVGRFLPKFVYFWLSGRLSARRGERWAWTHVDPKENERGALPADERIAWRGVWIAEAYLPSNVQSLVEGLEHLGWWQERGHDESIAESIRRGRAGHGGGWAALPFLHKKTKRGVMGMRSFDRDLPPGVDYVMGHIHHLTPSLTVLVVGFRFGSVPSDEVNDALRRHYRTFHTRLGWYGSRVHSPDFQRRDAVRDLEKRHIGACRSWLAQLLPGYFAAVGRDAPSVLLLTTQQAVPFERTEQHRWWTMAAGLDFAFEQWETGIPGLVYADPPRVGSSILTGRERDIFADEEHWKRYGHEDYGWTLMHEVDEHSGMLAFLAVGAILRDARRRLGELRDSVAVIANSTSRRQLAAVRSQLGTMSSDLTALTGEVLNWGDDPRWILHDVPKWKVRADPPKPDDEPLLARRLLDWFIKEARDVRAFESSTRGLLIAAAEITSAMENIWIQRVVLGVSILALIVALAALGVSWAQVTALNAPSNVSPSLFTFNDVLAGPASASRPFTDGPVG